MGHLVRVEMGLAWGGGKLVDAESLVTIQYDLCIRKIEGLV